MRAFEFFNDFGNTLYPDDCKRIWGYLKDRGVINFSKNKLDRYYRDFSDNYCAGWLCISDETLEEFAEWLSRQEI